jgi:hypothetical protein
MMATHQPSFEKFFSEIPPQNLLIVLLGREEDDKSSLGNVLLGFEPNDQKRGFQVATTSSGIKFVTGKWRGMPKYVLDITVVDLPGFDDNQGHSWMNASVRSCLEEVKKRPHVLLWVRRAEAEVTDGDLVFIRPVVEFYGEYEGKKNITKKMMVVLTQ